MRTATRLPPESSTTGSGDALDDLERDHRSVEQLFARSSLVEGDARLTLVTRISEALTAHTALEEDVIYPAIAEAVAGGELLVKRHRAEHDDVDALLARLGSSAAEGDDFVATMRQLQLAVQAHVAVEEALLFPAYRAAASAADMERLTNTAAKARRDAGR
jgi:hemerythrin superfamily protein